MSKYRIFISSNQKELKEERIAVKEIITSNSVLREFFDVFLFEDLPAKGRSPVSTYLRQVDNSDIYIDIIGNEYGAKSKDGLSPTETEFKRFTKPKLSREVLIFIKGKDDAKRDKETQRFIKTITGSYIYKRFANTDELKAQVLNSLISFLDEKGMFSKIPFDRAISRESEYEAIDEKEVRDFLGNRAIKLKDHIELNLLIQKK